LDGLTGLLVVAVTQRDDRQWNGSAGGARSGAHGPYEGSESGAVGDLDGQRYPHLAEGVVDVDDDIVGVSQVVWEGHGLTLGPVCARNDNLARPQLDEDIGDLDGGRAAAGVRLRLMHYTLASHDA
jgi:hypothetical protein